MHPTTRRHRPSAVLAAGVLLSGALALAVGWGPLDPPVGPVAPTAKPIAEVEPRTAINAANTPGDADSVFRITQPGSYYLTGNVTGVAAKRGIEVAVENVSIDLNGFELIGVPGSLDGVNASLIGNVKVSNGTLRGWGGDGLHLSDFANVSGVTSRSNTGLGVYAGQSAVLSGCIAELNGAQGFFANAGSVVSTCTSRANTLDGFTLNMCATTGCTSRVNGGNGFTVQAAGNITQCSGSYNGGVGLSVATGTTFGTVVTDCAFSFNDADGVAVSGNSTVRGCTLHGNGDGPAVGAGIRVTGADCRIEGNHCTDNERGIVATVAGSFFVRNTCATNSTNWDIAANNIVGPIVDRTAPGSAAIVGNSAPSSLGTTDPNANFTY